MCLYTNKIIILLFIIVFCHQPARSSEKQNIVFSSIQAVPGYASLYRQHISLPFFNPLETVTLLIESNYPPVPEQMTKYLKITHGTNEIYKYTRSNEEHAEFLGICRDLETQMAQIVLAEYSPYRGEPSKYIFIYYNADGHWIGKYRVDTIVALSALARSGKEKSSTLDEEEIENPFLTVPSGIVPECRWAAVSSLHNQIQHQLNDIIDQTTALSFNNRMNLTKDTHPINNVTVPESTPDLLKSVSQAIENGDARYSIELMDGDDTQEIIALSFYEPIGKELSGESLGVLLRVDQKSKNLQSLFNIEQRPYSYGGLCDPLVWIYNPTTLHGWLAEGAQPCRYYPVEIDLEKMEYHFLSNRFQYDPDVFSLEDIQQGL